jgi:pectinesterase
LRALAIFNKVAKLRKMKTMNNTGNRGYRIKGMNKIFVIIYFLLLISNKSYNQSTKGITGVPDTSYSTYSAYNNTIKTHPDISIVSERHSAAIKEEKSVVYCSINERKLVLDAFYPSRKSERSGIAVMIIHGGGWRTGNRSQHYPLAQRLAELGYTCFTPEYRLSTEALYPAAVYDLKAAIRWIRAHASQYGIDKKKLVVAGFSAGGELAAFLGTTGSKKEFEGNECVNEESTSVQAVVDMDGTLSFVHPESGEGDDSRSISAATYWFGYSKKENPDLWTAASPLTHADASTPPTLFLNSAVDRMHAGRTDYIKILDQNKIYSQVKTFEGAPHSFVLFQPWFDPMVNDIDKFLKKVFK